MGQYDRMERKRRRGEGKKREEERGKLTLLLESSRDKLVSGDPDVLGRGHSLEADFVLVRLKERKEKERKGRTRNGQLGRLHLQVERTQS
jgi:hypothetical protein